MPALISVEDLKQFREQQTPHALLDVREKGEFVQRHIFRAVPMPRGQIELLIEQRIPDKSVPVIVYDIDGHRAELAAQTLEELGYQDVRVLEGGLDAWAAAGGRTDYGTNVPGKDWGEKIAVQKKTPHLTPDEIVERQKSGERIIILDSRTQTEYERNHVPGAYIVPGGELPSRIHTVLEAPENRDATIVVNCAGRTRSIVGADVLIRMGVHDKVYALENGTMAWSMAGHELERGPGPSLDVATSPEARESVEQFAARVAAEDGVQTVTLEEFQAWRASGKLHYAIDVRLPEEFAGGHIPNTFHIAAGQIALEADEIVAVNQAPVVMISNSDVRARIGGSLARQIGYPNVYVLTGGIEGWTGAGNNLVTSDPEPAVPGLDEARAATTAITGEALKGELAGANAPLVVDVRGSGDFALGHIENARWVTRGDLERRILSYAQPVDIKLITVCNDGVRSAMSAKTLQDLGFSNVLYLEGGLTSWTDAGGDLVQGLDGADVSLREAKDDVGMLDRRGPLARNRQDMIDYLEWEIALGDQYEEN
jgi:rhodanese-related sulfurtransferase